MEIWCVKNVFNCSESKTLIVHSYTSGEKKIWKGYIEIWVHNVHLFKGLGLFRGLVQYCTFYNFCELAEKLYQTVHRPLVEHRPPATSAGWWKEIWTANLFCDRARGLKPDWSWLRLISNVWARLRSRCRLVHSLAYSRVGNATNSKDRHIGAAGAATWEWLTTNMEHDTTLMWQVVTCSATNSD